MRSILDLKKVSIRCITAVVASMDKNLMLSTDAVSVQPLIEPSARALGEPFPRQDALDPDLTPRADRRAKKDEIIGDLANMVFVSPP